MSQNSESRPRRDSEGRPYAGREGPQLGYSPAVSDLTAWPLSYQADCGLAGCSDTVVWDNASCVPSYHAVTFPDFAISEPYDEPTVSLYSPFPYFHGDQSNLPLHRDFTFPSREIMHKGTVARDRVIQASRERRKIKARFTCGLGCGQTFTARHNLTHHINSHLGIKPYTCRTCSKSFVTPCDCKRHERKCRARIM